MALETSSQLELNVTKIGVCSDVDSTLINAEVFFLPGRSGSALLIIRARKAVSAGGPCVIRRPKE